MTASSTEFRLMVEACRWVFAGGDPGNVHRLCHIADFARFVRVVRFHRVQGLVWNSLWVNRAQVPTDAANTLSADAAAIAAANLRMAAEASSLRAEFDEAAIPLLFVKGLTVGALAYPNPMLKMGWDIDLLIDPAQLEAAVERLQARGYRQVVPPASVDFRPWHERRKESVWSRDPGIDVELHTRLADNLELIPTIDVHSSRQHVRVLPGTVLPTLARDELFAYLCVHGASSNWFRVKWIVDVAALIHGASSAELTRLYARSQELGAFRAAGQALLLADRLFGSLAGTSLRERLTEDRTGSWLADAAFRQLAGRTEPREPTAVPLGTWRIHMTQLGLKPGVAFKFGEISRQVTDAFF
ncbi:MAG TPA: nucleotidyltransferase family protein [Sphingomicrobium sp.]|nr:nucleotidyltransferase family protein [Sphingomicrobium sp.]